MDRAHEEIKCLNLEIPHVVTSIVDEEVFLQEKEAVFQEKDPALAHQISIYQKERGRSNALHMQRFRALSKVTGFTGSIKPGFSVEKAEKARLDGQVPMTDIHSEGAAITEKETAVAPSLDEEEENEEQADEDIAATLFSVLSISTD